MSDYPSEEETYKVEAVLDKKVVRRWKNILITKLGMLAR